MTDYVHIDITPLVEPPSVEEEFTMEKNIVVLNECQDKEELRNHAITFARQNFHQSQFISKCLEQIAFLQAKVICAENPVKQPEDNWLQKLIK
tara:strand:+ start:196 stop:474 length:279 start_codon:yes stop_codon:yes gene_type:complete